MGYKQGEPFMRNGGWKRADTYQSDDTSLNGIVDEFYATGPNDQSPSHSTQHYNSECSCCYLGIKHTAAYHTLSIAQRKIALATNAKK